MGHALILLHLREVALLPLEVRVGRGQVRTAAPAVAVVVLVALLLLLLELLLLLVSPGGLVVVPGIG